MLARMSKTVDGLYFFYTSYFVMSSIAETRVSHFAVVAKPYFTVLGTQVILFTFYLNILNGCEEDAINIAIKKCYH